MIEAIHGPTCPLRKLDEAIADNPVLQRAIDLDLALSMPGFALTLDEIDVEEWEAIKILRNERDKYQSEQMKQPSGK